MSTVVAVTVETQPAIDGWAEGMEDVGAFDGERIGDDVGADVRYSTQYSITVSHHCC